MTNRRGVGDNEPKYYIVLALIAAVLLALSPAYAVPPVNNAPGVTLKGYDPVAYFAEGKPVKGSGEYVYQWMGATWHFSSAEHRDLFAKDPEKYAPQYGGYCAYAVSLGSTSDVDPHAWKIVNGKLYLNLNPDVAKIWSQDIPGNITKADRNWPTLRNR